MDYIKYTGLVLMGFPFLHLLFRILNTLAEDEPSFSTFTIYKVLSVMGCALIARNKKSHS